MGLSGQGVNGNSKSGFVVTQTEHAVLSKSQIRQEILSKIKTQGKAWSLKQGEQFSKMLMPLLVIENGVWGGYRPMQDEPQVDLLSLLGLSRIAFPLTSGLNLEFRKFITQWKTADLGFESPRDGETVAIDDLCGLVIPCVGISKNGIRLGRGAGFYDRALAEKITSDRILKIGLCYDFGILKNIPEESHDMAVDLAVTESQVILFNLKYKDKLVEMGLPFSTQEKSMLKTNGNMD